MLRNEGRRRLGASEAGRSKIGLVDVYDAKVVSGTSISSSDDCPISKAAGWERGTDGVPWSYL